MRRAQHLAVLRELGVEVIPPVAKRCVPGACSNTQPCEALCGSLLSTLLLRRVRRLACGDVGVGAMAEVETLVASVRRVVDALALPREGDDDDGARAAAELDGSAH